MLSAPAVDSLAPEVLLKRSRRWSLLLLVIIFVVGIGIARRWLRVPLDADRRPHVSFVPAAKSPVLLEVVPLRMGSTEGPRCLMVGEAPCLASQEVVHAAYWVQHPRGTFLIDSGLSAHGLEDLQAFHGLQKQLLNFHFERGLGAALASAGKPPDVDFVLITHAHWDHTSGLRDLHAPNVVLGPAEEAFLKVSKPGTVRPDHLEGATIKSFNWDGPAYENFSTSHDCFGDGSVVLVPLPGHTPGSVGVFLSSVHGRRLFFIGDTAWALEGVTLPSHKSRLFSKMVDDQPDQLAQTLWAVHALQDHHPDLIVVPAHDGRAFSEVQTLVSPAPAAAAQP